MSLDVVAHAFNGSTREIEPDFYTGPVSKVKNKRLGTVLWHMWKSKDDLWVVFLILAQGL